MRGIRKVETFTRIFVISEASVEYSHSAKIQYKELQLPLSYICVYSEYGNEKNV